MKDLFSRQADVYAKYRPGYPVELIQYVLGFVSAFDAAWDCATGNGQAAQMLAPHFSKIFATDISAKQLDNAVHNPKISYSVTPAEKTPFADNSFDLITVAQAYHWFKFDEFQREVERVGKPGAVVAVWGYGLPRSGVDALDKMIGYFYEDVVGPYWDGERKWVEESYLSIPFTFQPLPLKDFAIIVRWSLSDLIGYLNSWSSVQHFIKAQGKNPVDDLSPELTGLWTDAEDKKSFHFPVFLRMGSVAK